MAPTFVVYFDTTRPVKGAHMWKPEDRLRSTKPEFGLGRIELAFPLGPPHIRSPPRHGAESHIRIRFCLHDDCFMCFHCLNVNVPMFTCSVQSRLPAMAPLRNGVDDPLWTNYPRGAVPVYTPGNCLIPVGRKPVVYRSPIDRGRERIWRNYVKYARRNVCICFVHPCIHFLFKH